MLAELFSIVAPVYLCAAMGFLWVRTGRAYDTALMTDLVLLVGAPCLAFSSLVSSGVDLVALREMVVAVVLATGAMAGVSGVILRLWGLPLSTFWAPMTFGNTGNMGIPIAYFAFGDEGLALGVCFFAATSVLQFTAGQAMWSGERPGGELLRSPLIWAALLAVVVLAADLAVPSWLLRTTELMGGFTIPVMQFTLGVSLARLELTSIRRTFALAVLKIALGASVGFAMAALLGFEGVAAGVLVLNCAMPVAVFNYMFASKYQRSPAEVASIIVLSTLIAIVTIPILISFLLGG
jgi:predicted permease